jgi:GNAT superfamily N-acetyltransferase
MTDNLFRKMQVLLPVGPLVAAVKARPELWKLITTRQDYEGSAQHDTECIFLRWCKDHSVAAAFRDLDAEWCAPDPAVFEAAVNLLTVAMPPSAVHQLGRVILTNLKAGGTIDLHADEGAYAEHFERFHISLESDDGNLFFVDGQPFYPKPGELWWFNHRKPHTVMNRSSRDRWHMIIDAVPAKGLKIAREPFHLIYPDAAPLLRRHWEEIAHYQDIPLDVDEGAYAAIEGAGQLRCFGARLDGELVGYAAYFVRHNAHYRASLQATQDVLFVAPEHRKSRIGWKLIKFADDALRAEGVQVVLQHSKVAHDIGPILKRQGYEAVDTIYAKRLDGKAE